MPDRLALDGWGFQHALRSYGRAPRGDVRLGHRRMEALPYRRAHAAWDRRQVSLL